MPVSIPASDAWDASGTDPLSPSTGKSTEQLAAAVRTTAIAAPTRAGRHIP